MITFLLGIAALILGYVFYGKITERIFGIKPENPTPANRLADGVDYVPMARWKNLLLHLINIAGTGPNNAPTTTVTNIAVVSDVLVNTLTPP